MVCQNSPQHKVFFEVLLLTLQTKKFCKPMPQEQVLKINRKSVQTVQSLKINCLVNPFISM